MLAHVPIEGPCMMYISLKTSTKSNAIHWINLFNSNNVLCERYIPGQLENQLIQIVYHHYYKCWKSWCIISHDHQSQIRSLYFFFLYCTIYTSHSCRVSMSLSYFCFSPLSLPDISKLINSNKLSILKYLVYLHLISLGHFTVFFCFCKKIPHLFFCC